MAVGMESREEAEGELGQPGEGAGGRRRHLPTSILPRPNWRREYTSKAAQVTPGPQEQHTHLVLHWHVRGRGASTQTRGAGPPRLLRGLLWGSGGAALGPGSGVLRFLGSVDVSALASRTLGLSCSSGKAPTFPTLVAFPAPSSGAFFLGRNVIS